MASLRLWLSFYCCLGPCWGEEFFQPSPQGHKWWEIQNYRAVIKVRNEGKTFRWDTCFYDKSLWWEIITLQIYFFFPGQEMWGNISPLCAIVEISFHFLFCQLNRSERISFQAEKNTLLDNSHWISVPYYKIFPLFLFLGTSLNFGFPTTFGPCHSGQHKQKETKFPKALLFYVKKYMF